MGSLITVIQDDVGNPHARRPPQASGFSLRPFDVRIGQFQDHRSASRGGNGNEGLAKPMPTPVPLEEETNFRVKMRSLNRDRAPGVVGRGPMERW
jgi:hypothetical protein